MLHKVKVTVIDKKCFVDLQEQYCHDPKSGPCPCYQVEDEFIFERYGGRDDYWHGGLNTLVKTTGNPETIAGGSKMPFCSEVWDAISRYIYTGLQGGSIMKGWMKDENTMITCCNDGTRPVIFKIERLDYKALYVDDLNNENLTTLTSLENVSSIEKKDQWVEVFLSQEIDNQSLLNYCQGQGIQVLKIDE